MCGIIGIVGKQAKAIRAEQVDSMLGCLRKRGPDEQASVRLPGCVLGQTRLSIIDLAGGHQPMKDNARLYTIVFNGEIYNYQQLRKNLEKKGHTFSTKSDTEVILKAYAEYGEACPQHLDGMFAFAIWDEEDHKLFMARDRFGKKPFYYAFSEDGSLFFASEIKSLINSGAIKPELDMEAIDNYLTLMYIPPWKSIYKNINVLSPAYKASFKDGKLNEEQYWSLPKNPQKPTYDEAKQKIKALLEKAVQKRMIADVEIGSLLSGGVDSTLTSYLAQQCMDRPIKTFSLGYEDYINELPFAEQASKKIGSDHHTLQATAHLNDELKKVIEYFDEPHADSANIAQHLVSEFAGSKVKVALSGDGADELFMGYGWYWKYDHTQKSKRILNAIFSSRFKEHIKSISVFSESERKKLWLDASAVNADILPAGIKKERDGITRINIFDLTVYLPGQLLSKVDRTSMMHSLEIRCPFLDTDLAEYVFNIPTEYKMNGYQGKIILKDILAEIMPKDFVYRRKQGFGAPVKEWLEQPAYRHDVEKLFLHQEARVYAFLNKEYIQNMVRDFYHGTEDDFYKIWTLYCLELWLASHDFHA